MTADQADQIPADLESNYFLFRGVIRDALRESLENGDPRNDMRFIYGDFMRAMAHTLRDYDAPAGTMEIVTA